MNAPLPSTAPFAFDLVVPQSGIGFGPLRVDLVPHIADVVRPILRREPSARVGPSGGLCTVFHCQLADGEGMGRPIQVLGLTGYVGFRAQGGRLAVTVPPSVAAGVEAKLRHRVLRRAAVAFPDPTYGAIAGIELVLDLEKGQRATIGLGPLGEIGIEAG